MDCAAKDPTCTLTDRRRRGLCDSHYARLRRHGDPHIRAHHRDRGDIEERFWAKVEKTDGCWLWTAGKNARGYGVHSLDDGRRILAHRFGYQLLVGPIEDGLEIDHLCRVPACVRPDHLEPVTHAENVRRGEAGIANKSKTHCIHGHEFTPENTIVRNGTQRQCRECLRIAIRDYMRRRRAASKT